MFEGLIFTVADEAQRSQVFELRRKIYEEELGHHGIDEFDEGAHHLVACDSKGDVVAALRVIGPEHRPFDLEQFLSLSDLLLGDRLAGEISRFCIRRDCRQVRSGYLVQAGMLKLTHTFGLKYGLSAFVTLALPHLRNLYRLGFFRPLSAPFTHPVWGEVHPMCLDLVDLERRHSQSEQPMARLLFGTDLPNFIV